MSREGETPEARRVLDAVNDLHMDDIRALFMLAEEYPRIGALLDAENTRRRVRASRPLSFVATADDNLPGCPLTAQVYEMADALALKRAREWVLRIHREGLPSVAEKEELAEILGVTLAPSHSTR